MRSNNTKGIIYRIYSSGQSDKIIHLIDSEGAKNTLLAKGAKKSTSRKSHSIELCNQVEVKSLEGYQIPIITEIKVINEFLRWKKDNLGMLVIQLFCEVIDKLCYENNKDKDLFYIFFNALSNYNSNLLLVTNAFLLKAIWHTGSIASINTNALTGQPLSPDNIFYCHQLAGYVAKEDLARNIELIGESVSAKIAKGQKYLIEHPIADSNNLIMEPSELLKMLQINLDWFEIITEQRLKSKGIILSLVGKLHK